VEEFRLQVDEVEPPEFNVRLVGLQAAVRPLGGVTELETSIVPWNPLRLVIVTVDVLEVPVGNVTVDGLAATAKSATVTVTVAVCVSAPLEAVTVAVYTPPGPEHVRVDV
jgi:hypothetical protein